MANATRLDAGRGRPTAGAILPQCERPWVLVGPVVCCSILLGPHRPIPVGLRGWAAWHDGWVSPTDDLPSTPPPLASALDGEAFARQGGVGGNQTLLMLYGRVVTWPELLAAVALLLVLMSLVALVGIWFAWHKLAVRVLLQDQQAVVTLPADLRVQAAVQHRIGVRIDQRIPVRLPLSQDVELPLTQALPVQVSLQTSVPVRLDVPIDQVIKIDQRIDVDTNVHTKILGFGVTLPIKGQVPIRADVPVHLHVPVSEDVPVTVQGPATVTLLQPLHAHVQTVLQTEVPIHESLSLPLTRPIDANLHFTQPRIEVGLSQLDMTVPFDAVGLSWRGPLPAWLSARP